jgi:cobalt-zinc-cadmium efflux system membrane fusion protein
MQSRRWPQYGREVLARSCSNVPGRSVVPFVVRHLAALAALLCWMATAPAAAHEGHDLEPAEAAAASYGLPRLVANSESYELAAVLESTRLVIYLDRFADNSPVTDAHMTVTVNEEPVVAEATGDGTYSIMSKLFERGGLFELVFDIKAPETDDLLIGKLSLASAGSAGGSSDSMPWYSHVASAVRHGAQDHLVLMSLMLLVGLVLGIGLRRRRRGYPVPILVLAFPALAMALMGEVARAHEGHTEDDARPAISPGDSPRRLPDGRVFLPKSTQRILDVRTVIVKPKPIPKAEVFVGRVMADPNRSGLVQSITGGRVIAPERGLPRMGQPVAKGDVLASIESPMAIADRTTISERMGEIEQGIAVAEAKLRRLRPMAERGVVPQSLVVETEAELEGLHRRRDVVRETRLAPEVLRAPIDGVVAMSRVVAGQVVAAQDVLFQIVDPNSLWIEAYDYGENDPAALEHATAIGGGNVAMKLSFQGWSRALQQQATVLHFAISDPTVSLRVGQPVTVTAQRGGRTIGVIIDRDAIVRGGNGDSIVWRHVEPEYFEARPVRTEPFDATHVLVAAGIGGGERIVIRGAELINQVR